MSLEQLHRLSIAIPAALALILITAIIEIICHRIKHRDDTIYYVYSKHMTSSDARRRYK